MTDKQIIARLKTDLDFERTKRKSLQVDLKVKEQELKNICKAFDIEYAIDEETGNLIGRCNKLYKKEQECEELRTDIKDIANLLDLDTVEEYSFSNIELEIKELKQQLDQLKVENDELKKANKHIEHNRNQKADKLIRIEKLITACSTGYTDEFIQELLVILHEPEPNSFENKYKATITEIKEIAEKRNYLDYNECLDDILQKISECEVENGRN